MKVAIHVENMFHAFRRADTRDFVDFPSNSWIDDAIDVLVVFLDLHLFSFVVFILILAFTSGKRGAEEEVESNVPVASSCFKTVLNLFLRDPLFK